jgi:hypothetical protein
MVKQMQHRAGTPLKNSSRVSRKMLSFENHLNYVAFYLHLAMQVMGLLFLHPSLFDNFHT